MAATEWVDQTTDYKREFELNQMALEQSMSPGAVNFLSTIEAHGMRSEHSVKPARRVRVDWVTPEGVRGHTDCIATSTLDAVKMVRDRVVVSTCLAKVQR
jgi:hypothetical protein